jgi:hypothetical protein
VLSCVFLSSGRSRRLLCPSSAIPMHSVLQHLAQQDIILHCWFPHFLRTFCCLDFSDSLTI